MATDLPVYSSTRAPAGLPTDIVSACVVASGIDTPYRAAGRGAAVVVLSTAAAIQSALLLHCPRHIRVVAPALTGHETHCATSANFSDWLINFLDALGMDHVALVGDTSLAGRVADFTLRCPARVRQLVLLHTEPPDEGVRAPAADDTQIPARALVMHWANAADRQMANISQVISELTPLLELQPVPGF